MPRRFSHDRAERKLAGGRRRGEDSSPEASRKNRMLDQKEGITSQESDNHPPRRGGCWKKGCGCGAFLLGCLVALLAFAPRLAGALVATVIEEEFGDRRAGDLVLSPPTLRWTSRQRVSGVRLLDPGGRRVAEATLELPSIGELIEAAVASKDGGVIRLGEYSLTFEADVVVDEEGRSNLEAALAPKRRGDVGVVIDESPGEGDGKGNGEIEDLLRRIELRLRVDCPRLTWTDPRLQVEGQRIALYAVRGVIDFREGGTMTVNIEGEQECETRGEFSLEVGLAGFSAAHDLLPAKWNAKLHAANLSGALVDRLSGQEGELGTLLGDTFSVEGVAAGAYRELEKARFDLHSSAMRIAATGELDGNRFALLPESSVIELSPTVAAERVRAWSARLLPEGMSILFPEEGLPLEVKHLSLGFPVDTEDFLADVDFDLELALGAFEVTDPLGKGHGEVLPLSGLEFTADLTAGEAPRVQVATSFADAPGSSLVITVDTREALSSTEAREDDDPIPPLDISIQAEGVPIDRLRALAAVEDPWEELWGGRLSFTAKTTVADGRPIPFRVQANTETADLLLEGELTEERLRFTGRGLDGELRVPKHVFADLVSRSLPEKYLLSSRKAVLPLQLRIEELDFDLVAMKGDAPLSGSSFRMDFEVGAVDYTEEMLARKGQQVSLKKSFVRAELGTDGSLTLDLDSTLAVKGGGVLNAHLTSADLAALLDESSRGTEPFSLRAEAARFPTEVVDTYADQDGLLVDVLGPSIDVVATSDSFTLDGGPLSVDASSELGTFRWDGHYEEGVLKSGEGGRLEASVGLTPLLGERVVGPLIPLLVNLKKPDASPVLLRATELTLPLDGDLSRLDGKLRLELGQVTCSLLPGLASEFAGLASKAIQTTDIKPLDLSIEKGVVRYDRLPLKIDGRPIVLSGSYNLARGTLDLSSNLRLGDIGGEVGHALRSVRKTLGDDYTIPIHIGGTPTSPKVSLERGFLERAMKDAGEKALEKELEKGLKKGLEKLFGG
jgi:hypothetical protein